jgi:TonB-linked SusC/RagA family outer membrane protein
VLRFSYIGQKTVDRTVGVGSVVDVQMEEDAETLEEVVVTGYRTTTKEKSTVATQTITAETIENRPNASVVQTLSGQVAGLDISTASGQPGANSLVRLRGVNSINGNVEPLFIIDGTPVNEDNFRSLNPQDIESIDVLKDAGATAIYGNRGANGVVVIKTRSGNFNTPLQIDYTGIVGFNTLPRTDYNLMDSQELLTLENERSAGRGAGLTPQEIAAAPTFEWLDFFFRTGLTQNHTLRLSSGAENFTQSTSLGYFDQEGILQDSDLKRFNVRNNITGRSDNDRFNYASNININYSKSNEPNNIGSGAINRNYVLGANIGVPYITPDEYTNGEDLTNPLSFANTPLFLLDRLRTYTRFEEEVRIIGSFNATYKITPNLTAGVQMGADYTNDILTEAEGPESFNAIFFGGAENPTSGYQQQNTNRIFTYNQVTNLTYANTWGKHTVNIGAYTEYFKAHQRFFGFFSNGLNPRTFFPGDGAGLIGVAIDEPTGGLVFVDDANATIRNAGLFSYFGQADYDYDGRYGFVGTIRRDASYRFSESNRWATFWSVSGRWNIHNEAFMDNSVFDVLKLRASYGTAGNQRIVDGNFFTAPDLTRSLFETGQGYALNQSIGLDQIGNTTLRWETVAQANIGLDFEVFDRRLRGTVDVYQKKTSDLFQDSPVSLINSVRSLRANVGELYNQGVDFTLNWDVIRSDQADGFNLTLNAVGNFNETEVDNIPTATGEIFNDDDLTGLRNGGIFNEYFVLRYAGVNPANGNLLYFTADGEVTENPDPDTDRVWLGKNLIPEWVGSFGFNLDYKGFYVQTQFNYVAGQDRFDFDYADVMDPSSLGQFRLSRDLFRAWTPDNRITDVPSLDAANLFSFPDSDRFLREADYIRLRFLQVGYNFPSRFLEKTGLNRLRVFGNAENLFTITKWRGFDAEGQTNGLRQYPTPQIYSVGVEIGL